MLVEEADGLRKQISELKEKNERLASQMEGVMSARGAKAMTAVETAFYREQMEDKDIRLKDMEKQLSIEREQFQKVYS